MNLTEYDGYEGEVGEEAGQPQAAVEADQQQLHVCLLCEGVDQQPPVPAAGGKQGAVT